MATPITSPTSKFVPHAGHRGHFLRHVLEMISVMVPGMFIGGAVFTVGAGLAAGSRLTWDEARLRYPEACLLTIGVVMSMPMVAWMRHRGHGWRTGGEMTAAMLAPAVALIGLFWLHAVDDEPLCGLYCAVMVPAMVGAMLLRRGEYGGVPTAMPMAG
jgi:flagellar biosynthetic protein FliP